MISKLGSRLENLRKTDQEEAPEQDDDVKLGNVGRKSLHPVFALQLVQQSGDTRAVLYGAITSTIDFNPSEGFSFKFEDAQGEHEVRVTGRNLQSVYDAVCESKMRFIKVIDDEEGKPCVERIKIENAEKGS